MKKLLLLVLTAVMSVGAWAEEVTIASFSNSSNTGWTIAGSPSYSNSGGYQLIASTMSITTPEITFSNYTDITITITARKYGGPNATQGKISVKQGSTELATYSPGSTTLTASSALSISPSDGTLVISCPGASSSKGCGISQIVIKGTSINGSGDGDDSGSGDGDDSGSGDGDDSGKYSYTKIALTDIAPKNIVSLVWTNSTNPYAITNDNGASNAPETKYAKVQNNEIVNEVADNTLWNIDYNTEDATFIIHPNGDENKWLYCTATNNGVRVGTNANKTFEIKEEYLYHKGTSRYLGLYNSADVRCYTSINSNISGQTLDFFIQKAPVTISAAEWATYVTPCAVDFTNSDIKAYAVSNIDIANSVVTISSVTEVPAGQTIIVNGATGYVPTITSAENITNNMISSAEDVVATGNEYILAKVDGEVCFAPVNAGTTIAAGKGYFTASSGARLRMVIGGGSTGISNVAAEKTEGVAFNLAGQRVNANAKGIVIVNGKKFINK